MADRVYSGPAGEEIEEDLSETQIAQATAILEEAGRKEQERAQLPYDGVNGVPPDAVPAWATSRFFRVREFLLDECGYSPERVLELIESYGNDSHAMHRIYPNGKPIDYIFTWHETVGFLAHLRWATQAESPADIAERLEDYQACRHHRVLDGSRRGHEAKTRLRKERQEQAQEIIDDLWATGSYEKHGSLGLLRKRTSDLMYRRHQVEVSVPTLNNWKLKPTRFGSNSKR